MLRAQSCRLGGPRFVRQHRLQLHQELVKRYRFGEHGDLNALEEGLVNGIARVPGDEDEPLQKLRSNMADFAVEQVSRQFWHVQIAQDGVNLSVENQLQRLGAVRRGAGLVSSKLEQRLVGERQFNVVIHYEHVLATGRAILFFHTCGLRS